MANAVDPNLSSAIYGKSLGVIDFHIENILVRLHDEPIKDVMEDVMVLCSTDELNDARNKLFESAKRKVHGGHESGEGPSHKPADDQDMKSITDPWGLVARRSKRRLDEDVCKLYLFVTCDGYKFPYKILKRGTMKGPSDQRDIRTVLRSVPKIDTKDMTNAEKALYLLKEPPLDEMRVSESDNDKFIEDEELSDITDDMSEGSEELGESLTLRGPPTREYNDSEKDVITANNSEVAAATSPHGGEPQQAPADGPVQATERYQQVEVPTHNVSTAPTRVYFEGQGAYRNQDKIESLNDNDVGTSEHTRVDIEASPTQSPLTRETVTHENSDTKVAHNAGTQCSLIYSIPLQVVRRSHVRIVYDLDIMGDENDESWDDIIEAEQVVIDDNDVDPSQALQRDELQDPVGRDEFEGHIEFMDRALSNHEDRMNAVESRSLQFEHRVDLVDSVLHEKMRLMRIRQEENDSEILRLRQSVSNILENTNSGHPIAPKARQVGNPPVSAQQPPLPQRNKNNGRGKARPHGGNTARTVQSVQQSRPKLTPGVVNSTPNPHNSTNPLVHQDASGAIGYGHGKSTRPVSDQPGRSNAKQTTQQPRPSDNKRDKGNSTAPPPTDMQLDNNMQLNVNNQGARPKTSYRGNVVMASNVDNAHESEDVTPSKSYADAAGEFLPAVTNK